MGVYEENSWRVSDDFFFLTNNISYIYIIMYFLYWLLSRWKVNLVNFSYKSVKYTICVFYKRSSLACEESNLHVIAVYSLYHQRCAFSPFVFARVQWPVFISLTLNTVHRGFARVSSTLLIVPRRRLESPRFVRRTCASAVGTISLGIRESRRARRQVFAIKANRTSWKRCPRRNKKGKPR